MKIHAQVPELQVVGRDLMDFNLLLITFYTFTWIRNCFGNVSSTKDEILSEKKHLYRLHVGQNLASSRPAGSCERYGSRASYGS